MTEASQKSTCMMEDWVFKVGLLNVRWSFSLFDHKLAISDKLSV